MINIGVDAMGGDYAPKAIIEGLALVLPLLASDERIVLYGDEQVVRKLMAENQVDANSVSIVHAPEVIGMDDHPTKVFARKQNSSIVRGFMELSAGKIDGFASAGSTGAVMVGAMMVVKQTPGVIRPALATCLPVGDSDRNVLLDVGLNPDCRPDVLYQYGILGSLYAKSLGMNDPKVALINIGEEPTKGNLVVKNAHEQMRETTDFNFVGNIEGGDIFSKKADVLVCDGFVGNVVLKMAESFYRLMRRDASASDFAARFNPERYGGTPVLGVNRPVIKGHGASSPVAIKNMILQAREVIKSNLCEQIRQTFS